MYDRIFMNDDPRISFLDILAGMWGMKVKFNEDYRNYIIQSVNDNYNNLESLIKKYCREDRSVVKHWYEIYPKLIIGYDEVIILKLFELITRAIDKEEINKKKKLLTLIEHDDRSISPLTYFIIPEGQIIKDMNYNILCELLYQHFELKEEYKTQFLNIGSELINMDFNEIKEYKKMYNTSKEEMFKLEEITEMRKKYLYYKKKYISLKNIITKG